MNRKKTIVLAFCLSTLVILLKLWDIKYVHGGSSEITKVLSVKTYNGIPKHKFRLLKATTPLASYIPTTESLSTTSKTMPSILATTPPSSSNLQSLIDDLPPGLLEEGLINNTLNFSPSILKTLPRDCIGVPRVDEKLNWVTNLNDCKSDTYIVWLIKSSIYRNNLRNFIRQTWAKDDVPLLTYGKKFTVRRIFLIGSEPDNHPIPFVEKEIEKYGDILQGSFIDTPSAITQKVFLGMMFSKDKCPHAKITIVADDEAMFAPWNLFLLLGIHLDTDKFYGGFTLGRQKPVRDKNSRWYISEKDYTCDYYPLHSVKTVYFMSKRTMEQMYYLGLSYQMFPMDNVLFGGLAEELGVEPKFFQNLHYSDCQNFVDPNFLSIPLKEQVVCNGTIYPNDQELVWDRYCQAPVVRKEVVDLNLAFCDRSSKSVSVNI